jgi:serine/threonine-protein kinase
VIHCDMKPANVMIDSAGKVSVNDFGIARLSESATVTFSTPGTAAYMAPEQWRGGEDVHPATDVYALGVMLYEFLTAQLPFTGSSVHGGGHTREKVMREHMSLEPPHASRINPQLPAMFDPVLRRCLEKDHAARYPNVGALLTDFEATCRTLGWPHTLEQSPPVVLPGSTTFDRPANQKQPISLSRLTRRPGLTVVGAGAAVLALVAVMLGSGRGTTQSNGLPTQNMASPALANVQRPTSQAEPSATLAPTPTSAIVPTLIATSIPTPACLDAPERRLSIGGRARVTYTTGLPSRVREAPGLSGRILGQAAEGTRMEILDGPECSDIGWWWWVKTANNVTGWMLEGVPEAYYLEPIP